MKARMPIQVSPDEYKRIVNTATELATGYAQNSADGTALAMCILLHDMYGFGETRIQRLIDALPVLLKDIRRQQDADNIHPKDNIDAMRDAVNRLKLIYKKICNIEWVS